MQDDSSVATYGGVAPNSSDEVAQQLFEGALASGGSKGHIRSSSTSSALPPVPQFPPPKTDKPRPHMCTTCMRSFARLEHLKRHERSHTKEKPFACSECTRCFARRDLLLRHQQKLHSSSTPSARPRNGRRESVAGGGTGRVRKNSVASNATSMRPRANTLSHVDAATIGMLTNTNPSFSRHFMAGHGHHNSMSGLHASHGYAYRGMSTTNHGSFMGLPKLETHGLPMDFSGGLRTAPPFGGFGVDIGMGYSSHQGNTINPHALHMDGLGIDHSDYASMLYANGQPPLMDEDGNFEWMTHGFEHQINVGQSNDNAIDDSSPSAMSTNSPAGPHDSVGDMHSASVQHHHLHNGANWSHQIANSNHMINSPMSMDLGSNFTDMVNGPTSTVSSKSLLAQGGAGFDMNLPTPPDMGSMEVGGINYQPFPLPYHAHGGASTASTASGDSSLRQSSITTNSSDIVNEGIRTMLLAGLSQNAPFGHRKQSQPLVSSPLSPDTASKTRGFNLASFPSTQDLRKYVNAYIRYFHPHLPFLHIPTLSFESPEYTGLGRGSHGQSHVGLPSVTTGGSCLLLSIAAIGAVYEGDVNESKELFECAKRLISNFLEERRRANLNRTQYGPRTPTDYEDTPLWLVQAMLLNVCYGHNCGDKTAAELASNHCAALVSLARGAELARPYQPYLARRASNQHQQFSNGDTNGWTTMIHENEEIDWFEWKIMEERKRTLYAVFILSSMLVTAYNHPPALTNSEIRLDLPCDEELWAVPSSQAWLAMGGAQLADSKTATFATALTHLLMASHRQRTSSSMDGQQQPESPESDLRPSAFGCLVLVNALHNYIWETRQRHLGRSWTAQETEQMHQHIEPALRAWQAAWASDPSHSLERPNPFGAGPLSADSIPLLDLAYVRLYLNLGRAKEAFWQRDFDAMAEELAKGPDTGVAASNPPSEVADKLSSSIPEGHETGASNGLGAEDTTEQETSHSQPSKHERQLRRAAFYAADSLLMSEKLDLSYSESTSKELPAQSAMCAFDCAQVLAAWVTTVQERVGKYLGVLGKDDMDLMQVPGILLLEDEDRQLLEKIEEFLSRTQERLGSEGSVDSFRESGYGARLLVLTAHLLESAAVWPVTRLMARSLETQATHMKDRALASVVTAQ